MSEVVLTIVIIALSALIGFQEYQNRKERNKLINAVMSKSAQELVNFDLADKVEITQPPMVTDEDLEAIADLSDKDFNKFALGEKEENG